jgi:hypothetical protein
MDGCSVEEYQNGATGSLLRLTMMLVEQPMHGDAPARVALDEQAQKFLFG